MNKNPKQFGFTLIELLVVIAIIAMLVAIILPSLNTARMLAKITAAHCELRGITLSLHMYNDEHGDYPPTRGSCSSGNFFELPIELTDYLPSGKSNGYEVTSMFDPFGKDQRYKYQAVGDIILNESTVAKNRSKLWVPDGFPGNQEPTDEGQYYYDPELSPVRYAIWSYGPNPDTSNFKVPGKLPLTTEYWLTGPNDDIGVITHFADYTGQVHKSY